MDTPLSGSYMFYWGGSVGSVFRLRLIGIIDWTVVFTALLFLSIDDFSCLGVIPQMANAQRGWKSRLYRRYIYFCCRCSPVSLALFLFLQTCAAVLLKSRTACLCSIYPLPLRSTPNISFHLDVDVGSPRIFALLRWSIIHVCFASALHAEKRMTKAAMTTTIKLWWWRPREKERKSVTLTAFATLTFSDLAQSRLRQLLIVIREMEGAS